MIPRGYQQAGAEWLADLDFPYRGRILCDPPGFGKRLDVDTLIPTPEGWTRMGDLTVGDTVFDEKGLPTRVTFVSEIEEAPKSFDVVFSDGSRLVADAEHQWLTWTKTARAAVYNQNPGVRHGWRYGAKEIITRPQIVTTAQIKETLRVGKHANHSVQLCGPVNFPARDLLVDPYLLGVWLGDGHSNTGAVTTVDLEILEAFRKGGYEITQRAEVITFGIGRHTSGTRFATQLREIGVLKNKHVPLFYLRASVDQRRALLAGLMDTDGTVSKTGACCFDNSNEKLANAVADLAASLGFKITRTSRQPKIPGRPQADCAVSYRVTFTPTVPVFRLARKVLRQQSKRRSTQLWRYITEVVPTAPRLMRCIAVDSPSHLYLAGTSYIPTHNTLTNLLAAKLWDRSSRSKYKPILVFTTAISRTDWKRIANAFWPALPVTMVAVDQPKSRKKITRRKTETDEEFAARGLRENESPEAFHARRAAVLEKVLLAPNTPHLLICSHEASEQILEIVEKHELLLGRVIVDEAHVLKHSNTLRAQTMRPLIGRAERTWLNTGTPIHNKAEDLHNLLDLCALGKFGSKWTFAKRFFRVYQSEGFRGLKIGNLIDKEGLAAAVSNFSLARSVEEAFGELPARIREVIQVRTKNGAHPLSRVSIRALTTGGSGNLDGLLRNAVNDKLDAAADYIADKDEPFVAYTYTREHAAALGRKLNARKCSTLLATGDLDPKKRAKVIDEWKAGAATVLVCTMDAVRESATLTRASAMAFVDLDYLPGKMLQCEGRIDPSRQPEGERRPARYYYFVTKGGVDEIVAERVVEKILEAQGIIGDDAEANRLANALRSAVPAPVKEDPAKVMADLIGRIEARASRLDSLFDDEDRFGKDE